VTGAAGPAGARARWREVDGIVLLDKPTGLTSTQALQRARRLLGAAKAGHAGTLDPLATGMLPLCFGQATKACGQLLGARKAYRAALTLGASTDTGDAEGAVTGRAALPVLEPGAAAAVLAGFCGERLQVPPMYSALKREGRPLYELARRGEEVPREARPIRIERLELLAVSPTLLEFEVVCSKGTYVRVLGEEIAAALGTLGHLAALRRLWVEPFEGEPMVALGELEAWAQAGAWEGASPPPGLLAVDRAFTGLPRVDLDARLSLYLRQGREVEPASSPSETGVWRAYDEAGQFLGLVEATAERRLRVRRLFVAGSGTSP